MARVLVYGVGDLGEKAAYLLAAFLSPADELIIAGRSPTVVAQVANMARMVARARRDPLRVRGEAFPLTEDAVRAVLVRLAPDVFLFMATLYSWWRVNELPAPAREALGRAGFAVWLPCQAALPLALAPVLRSLANPPWFALAPYPDVVAPLLARQGVRRVLGFGNVDELAMLLEDQDPPPRKVRLVAHHSVEAALFGSRPLPPYHLSVETPGGGYRTGTLPRPFPWPSGTRSHTFTAASLVRTLRALVGETKTPIHLPGPMGLPGGYPCLAGAGEVVLNLPSGLSEEDAIAINQAAARADGVERMESDGTVHLTDEAREGLREGLGIAEGRWTPASMREAAEMLVRRTEEMASNSS